LHRTNVHGAQLTDMGWTSDPVHMRRVLNEVKSLRKPVFVTENGIGTGDDERRKRYVADVLASVRDAIGDGVDVRGYFHWTNMDNFEWARGYGVKFGLIECDRATLERTVKPSGVLYGRIAAANALPEQPSATPAN